MRLTDMICAAVLGVLEGITEWLPVSSTGHLILLADHLPVRWSAAFWGVFLVGVQMGAILAVAVKFTGRLIPLARERGGVHFQKETIGLWGKILLACAPAAVVGLLYGEMLDGLFYNPTTVAIMLIAVGLVFLMEKRIVARVSTKYASLEELPVGAAACIGLCQVLAAVFPGTSRSGATMFGGILCGVSRPVAAEFTFLLGVPVMFGAGALKLWENGSMLTGGEWVLLGVGALVAFFTSLAAIGFLLSWLNRHGLAVFGWYRILLGVVVLATSYI